MRFAVHSSRRAEQNIRHTSAWIAKYSQQGAIRWLDALEQVIDRLAEAAPTYPLAAESALLPYPVHEISFRTPKGRRYRALYFLEGNRVDILCIRAPGQPPVTAEDLTD